MLFWHPSSTRLTPAYDAWVSAPKCRRIVAWIKSHAEPKYDESVLVEPREAGTEGEGGAGARIPATGRRCGSASRPGRDRPSSCSARWGSAIPAPHGSSISSRRTASSAPPTAASRGRVSSARSFSNGSGSTKRGHPRPDLPRTVHTGGCRASRWRARQWSPPRRDPAVDLSTTSTWTRSGIRQEPSRKPIPGLLSCHAGFPLESLKPSCDPRIPGSKGCGCPQGRHRAPWTPGRPFGERQKLPVLRRRAR